MHELIQQIVERTGISEETATKAVDTVVDYIKAHAPAPIASQVENYLSDEGATSAAGAATGALGGMFGKRDE
jgi:hypothetical protein